MSDGRTFTTPLTEVVAKPRRLGPALLALAAVLAR
jgi:hypothetical protein